MVRHRVLDVAPVLRAASVRQCLAKGAVPKPIVGQAVDRCRPAVKAQVAAKVSALLKVAVVRLPAATIV